MPDPLLLLASACHTLPSAGESKQLTFKMAVGCIMALVGAACPSRVTAGMLSTGWLGRTCSLGWGAVALRMLARDKGAH